jgi:hypothetical protein
MTMFHVAIGYKGPVVPLETIQNSFGTAGWARYAPNCWLVHSHTDTPQSIADRLRNLCRPEDTIFVVEIKPENYRGYLYKETWDWFNKHEKL